VVAIFVIVGVIPQTPVVIERVDEIEVNVVHDDNGEQTFTQEIFWSHCHCCASKHVVAWRFVKRPEQHPRRDYQRGGFVVIWKDGKTIRAVRAPICYYSWRYDDPEVNDRSVRSPSQRKGLAR
jgi:hypothetical protein